MLDITITGGPTAIHEYSQKDGQAQLVQDTGLTITEKLKQARQEAQQRRDQFKVRKNVRYSDAPMEAYARLARARTQSEVGAAAGFARRRIAQFKTAMRQDSENAPRIKAAVAQLQRAVFRANKKKVELTKERTAQRYQEKVQVQQRQREAMRLKLELDRRRELRVIRERGYLSEAAIDSRFQAHLEATSQEMKLQISAITPSTPTPQTRIGQYVAASSATGGVEPPPCNFSVEA